MVAAGSDTEAHSRTPHGAHGSGQEEATFGVWVRRLRSALDLTQEALAEQIGCATQTLRSFESGRRRPSRDMAVRLADILRVPQDERERFLRLARTPIVAETSEPGPTPIVAPRTLPIIDPLIGRQQELERLHTLIIAERRRLVTILGPGGVGKTRLAIQIAGDLASAFADGAVIVPLAPLTDAVDIPAAIATAAGCPLTAGHDPTAALLAFLGERVLLLVLDNLEHLLGPTQGEQTSRLLGAILSAASGICILTTSRERVHLQAEWTIELGGLELPADDTIESITGAEAVLLFVERARRVTDRFCLNPQNQAAVAAICRCLDGLPLAIELAAAQISFLPPTALLTRLSEALPLLEQTDRDVPARQRTMRAAIGWSDDLLRLDERTLFHRLAVFAGPFSLEAAEAVGVGGSIKLQQVLGLLRRLVDQSLVVREDAADDTARYRLLEPIRQFAMARLEEQPEEQRAARGRHAAHYCTVAEAAAPLLRGSAQVSWLAQLEADYPNIRAAMAWLIDQSQLEAAARFGYELWLFLWLRGHLREGTSWMEQILALLQDGTSLARAYALITASVLIYGRAGYEQATRLAEECLVQFRALNHAAGMADAVSMIGLSAASLRQHDRAVEYMADAVTRFLAVGNRWGAAMTLNYWATIPMARGEYRQAAALAEQSLALAREIGDQVAVYSALYNLALVAQHEGEPATAEQYFMEALSCALALGDLGNCIACLDGLGGVAAIKGDGPRAARLWGAAASLSAAKEMAVYGYAASQAWYAQMEATARAAVDATAWAAAWAEGQAMTLDQAVAEARCASESTRGSRS